MAAPRLADACAILGDLVAFPTLSSGSNLDLVAYAAGRLEDAGAHVVLDHDESETKANLFATIGPAGDGGIVLSGHTDVVPVDGQVWSSDPFRMIERDGRLYGRGTCDMKGFIACALALAPDIAAAAPPRPLHLALTYDEEVGCRGGQALVGMLLSRGPLPAVAIIGEPTAMQVIEGHKGCYEYTTLFRGRGGHASRPERGTNAIEHAAAFLAKLQDIGRMLRERTPAASPFDPPWTTLQAGRIEGGIARNAIAETCTVEWELRPVCAEDAAFVHKELEAHVQESLRQMRMVAPEADIVTSAVGEIGAFQQIPKSEARDIMLALTGGNRTGTVPFGTEAGLYQEAGISAIVCGPGSIEQAHQPDEFIEIAQLESCLGALERLARPGGPLGLRDDEASPS